MKHARQIAIEAAVVGLMTVLVGSAAGWVVGKLLPSPVARSDACRGWNDKHQMEISLFCTGALIHLICEVTGINKWYCTNGAACLA